MLAVQPQQFDMPRDEISLDSAPTLELRQTETNLKQQTKKSMFSPYKILLALAVAFMIVMVGFKIYNQFIVQPIETEIASAHGKIIQNAGDSSKDKASNSGSSSSKTTKTNDKPNQSSLPASKTPISSNSNLNGSSDSGSNDGNEDEEENDGEKRKKSMDKNKSSDTRSSKYGSSTDDDSESVESEEQNQLATDELIWPTDNREGPEPLIGSTRQ